MVQDAVGVVEDVPFADAVIAVVFAERCECPIGDVLLAVYAVLVVGVEGDRIFYSYNFSMKTVETKSFKTKNSSVFL